MKVITSDTSAFRRSGPIERCVPKYVVGTTVSRLFFVEDEGKERPFTGEVTGYNAHSKLYSVTYEDGDDEELEEGELSEIVVNGKHVKQSKKTVKRKKSGNKHSRKKKAGELNQGAHERQTPDAMGAQKHAPQDDQETTEEKAIKQETDDEIEVVAAPRRSNFYFRVVISTTNTHMVIRVPRRGNITFDDLRNEIIKNIQLPFEDFQFTLEAGGALRVATPQERTWNVLDTEFDLIKQGNGSLRDPYHVYIEEAK